MYRSRRVRRSRQKRCQPATCVGWCGAALVVAWFVFVLTHASRRRGGDPLLRSADLTAEQAAAAAATPPRSVPLQRFPRVAAPPAAAAARAATAPLRKAAVPRVHVELFQNAGCAGDPVVFDPSHGEHKCTRCFDTCRAKFANGAPMLNAIHSLRVVSDDGNNAAVDASSWSVSAFGMCAGAYGYSEAQMEAHKVAQALRPASGCVAVRGANLIRFDGLPHPDDIYVPQSYHVVYSAESSLYFGFQAYANLHAFQVSGQQQSPRTGYTRLLTAHEDDDLATSSGGVVPTFSWPRDPFSRRYTPYNKPHAVAAWMADVARGPKEEVIVIIDPDNWLTASLAPIAAKVKRGQGVAAAAFFDNNPLVAQLFKEHICERACDVIPDTIAVPYFVHREDLKLIAPLWMTLTKKIHALFSDPQIAKEYTTLQPGWCSEMYGYIYAAAELRIKHITGPGLQLRDVDGKLSYDAAQRQRIKMIHMGRAWFPESYANSPAASRWVHTEGKSLRPPHTEQVWCKCNATAADERPWPMPPGVDFVTNVTLTTLHESLVRFGNPPTNKFRTSYHGTYN